MSESSMSGATMTSLAVKWSTLLVDIGTLGTGGIILLVFITVVTPTRRGIYCDDQSIQYPFHPSTVPNYVLYIYGFTISFVLIILTEVLANRRNRATGKFLCFSVPLWMLFVYRSLVDFLFGMAACQLITDVGKYTLGRLRPNFISVCGPDIDFTNCSKYSHQYLENYECKKSDHDASESRVSFPSGHSSFSAYTMLYCAIFIQVKWGVANRSVLRTLKHGVQIALVLLAYFTAVSRVMDNKHHWSDVTAGGLIGAIVASLTARYVARLHPNSPILRAGNKEAHFEGITIDDDSESRRTRTPKDQRWNSNTRRGEGVKIY